MGSKDEIKQVEVTLASILLTKLLTVIHSWLQIANFIANPISKVDLAVTISSV